MYRHNMEANMLRPFVVRGGWLRPGYDKRHYAGTLRYHPSRGLKLTVHGADLGAFGVDTNQRIIDRVCGESVDGKSLSACDGFLTRAERGYDGLTTAEFLFHRLFVGTQCIDDQGSRFDVVDVSFNQLLECIGAQVGTQETCVDDVLLRSFRPASATLLKDTEKHIMVVYKRKLKTHYLGGDMRVQTEPLLRTEFSRPVSLNTIYELLLRLQYLIAFMRHCRVLPIRVAVRLHSHAMDVDEDSRWYNLYFVPVGARFALTPPPPTGPNISFANLGSERHEPVERILGHWLDTSARNALLMSLYFGERYGAADIVENRFLNLTQALETFHRSNFKNEQLPSAEHEARLASILSSCPAQNRSWLEDKLRHSNEPSLRQRFRNLLGKYHAYTMGVLPASNIFINHVVSTRNNLAHGLKSSANGPSLYFLNTCLSALIEAILFKEIGLSDLTTLHIVQGRWTGEAQRWMAELHRPSG